MFLLCLCLAPWGLTAALSFFWVIFYLLQQRCMTFKSTAHIFRFYLWECMYMRLLFQHVPVLHRNWRLSRASYGLGGARASMLGHLWRLRWIVVSGLSRPQPIALMRLCDLRSLCVPAEFQFGAVAWMPVRTPVGALTKLCALCSDHPHCTHKNSCLVIIWCSFTKFLRTK